MDMKEQYKRFDPQQYINQYFVPESDDWGDHLADLEQLHHIFKSGKIHGKRLLDVGTGPSILSIISASRHFDEIYLTDYAESNISFLTSWWKGNSVLQSEGIQFVLDKEDEGETVSERTQYMKNIIKSVEFIDITEDDCLKLSSIPKQYDVLSSAGCLDAAVSSMAEYEQCVKNIRSLLKIGGHIVLLGEIGESYYDLGGITYTCMKLDSSVVRKLFEENGFRVTYWRDKIYDQQNASETDSKGRMTMVAEKIAS